MSAETQAIAKESHARGMRLVFCGTPQFAVPTLAALLDAGHTVELVLTQPDRPVGRGLQLLAPPVKQYALQRGLPVEQPEKIRNNEALRTRCAGLAPDAIVVVAYGRILPPWMLDLPRLGCINLHASLLPKYRGAAPIQWAIAHGEQITGVTTMLLEEGLDTGPMLEQAETPIGVDETADALFMRLASFGAPWMVSTLDGLGVGTLKPQTQDADRATYAPLLTREDGRAHFALPSQVLYDRWRGFQPWPGLWSSFEGRKFTLKRVRPANALAVPLEPGALLVQGERLYAGCGGGSALELLEVQLEGKRAMPAAEFLRGHGKLTGTHLV